MNRQNGRDKSWIGKRGTVKGGIDKRGRVKCEKRGRVKGGERVRGREGRVGEGKEGRIG